jgi:hypothetical protein
MKRSLLLLVVAALSVGCEVGPQLRSAQGLSTEPTTWRGNPGTAVTIRFATSTKQLEGAGGVGFKFRNEGIFCRFMDCGPFWEIADFTVPVIKLEPRAVVLFFSKNRDSDSIVLSHLPEEIRAGTLRVIPCNPNRVC